MNDIFLVRGLRMDVQLQDLIDKIKSDGVLKAEEEAKKIISEAEKKATSIVSDAKKNANEIVENAKRDAERFQKSTEDSLSQASRNIILSFRSAIENEVEKIIQLKTNETFSPSLLEKIIPETVKAWSAKTNANELSVLLSEKDLASLSSAFQNLLKDEIANGLELKADKTLSGGFRIGVENGKAFYDYSAETVAKLFASYVNEKTKSIVQKSLEG